MKNPIKNSIKIGICSLLLGFNTLSIAEDVDVDAVIKYRQGVMQAQGGHMGAMAMIVRGKVDYSDQLIIHAQALDSIIGNTAEMFPEGSDFGETEAKEEIWQDWDKFEKASKNAKESSKAFLNSVEKGDKQAIGERFKDLGKACKDCHKKFRKEEDH
jgi:cytochrome c556